MTTFDRREEAFENRFFHDEDLAFKATARRNLKLGHWAAGLLGKAGPDADVYAQGVVDLAVSGGGDAAVVAKLRHDFEAHGVARSEHQIQREIQTLHAQSLDEVRSR